ncbi:hypothetical protein [Micromonospora craterilacus]|uniref:hypothetical protein n=1 Tax=Micromonospora craterilacus TaxID=1655439 RepID=UPI0018F3DDC8|nr:hypothetical protein [Micromonospora craterilacus]
MNSQLVLAGDGSFVTLYRRQIRTPGRQTHDDGCVEGIYPDNGNGGREASPEAVPGLRPETEGAADATSLTVEVDGEVFVLRSNEFGGTDYTWLSTPAGDLDHGSVRAWRV